VVSFPKPGHVLIGHEARERMGGEAQWTIASPKRLLGRAYKDPQVGSLLGPLALRTFAGTDKLIRFDAHGEIYSVTDVCAMILGKLRERACRYLNADVTKAVFAVPVAFGSLHRSALELAAKQAGLQGVAMLTEPSAALLAHGFRGRSGLETVFATRTCVEEHATGAWRCATDCAPCGFAANRSVLRTQIDFRYESAPLALPCRTAFAGAPVRISVKFLLDGGGSRPASGDANTDADVGDQVERANEDLRIAQMRTEVGQSSHLEILDTVDASARARMNAVEAAYEANAAYADLLFVTRRRYF